MWEVCPTLKMSFRNFIGKGVTLKDLKDVFIHGTPTSVHLESCFCLLATGHASGCCVLPVVLPSIKLGPKVSIFFFFIA